MGSSPMFNVFRQIALESAMHCFNNRLLKKKSEIRADRHLALKIMIQNCSVLLVNIVNISGITQLITAWRVNVLRN